LDPSHRRQTVLLTLGDPIFGLVSRTEKEQACLDESEVQLLRRSYTFRLSDFHRTLEVTIADPARDSFKLTYSPDTTFEPLARQAWRLTPKNNAPSEYCSTLRFSTNATAGITCCNSIGFAVSKGEGDLWYMGNNLQTLVGCRGDRGKSDGHVARKLLAGFKIDETGRLIADPTSSNPYVFEPVVTSTEDDDELTPHRGNGRWRLTSALRISDDPQLSPRYRIFSVESLESLDMELVLDNDHVDVTVNCLRLTAPVIGRRGKYVRTGRSTTAGSPNIPGCERKNDAPMTMIRHLPAWIVDSRGGVLLVTYLPEPDELEITREGNGFQTYRFIRIDDRSAER
jgi:hypothetical protein